MKVRERPSIPDEIVDEIIIKLPAKSLMRFRCVSKIWLHKIDSLAFAIKRSAAASASASADEDNQILQLTFASKPPFPFHLLTLEDGNIIKRSAHPILELPNNIQESNFISHSAYGLFCFHTRGGVGKAYLCNPLRKEVLELPQATAGGSWLDFYGMGFDGTTSTYKIVRVFGKRSEIYTLGTSSWREISSVPPEDLDNMSNGVSAYGDMHWADDDHFSFGQRKGVDNCVIISFDFKKEEFKRTPTPDFGSLSYEHERFVMINLKGCLAIVILTPEDIEIWMMKDYDRKEWVKEYKITHNCELIIKEFCLYVGAWGPGVVLDAYCSQKLPVVVFDLKTREVLNLQVPLRVDYNRRNYSYAANILSLRHLGNIIGAEEDRRCQFLKTADLVYLRP